MTALLLVLYGVLSAAGNSTPDTPLHFRPKTGVLGDTIPFFWKDTYHVYYLKGSGWGHITSRDLVHWEHRPDALAKGGDKLSPDGENCWTGSIVENAGTFHLFYTGKNSADPKGDQKVMHAVGTDLDTWTKQPGDTFYADGVIYWSKPVNGAIDDKLIYHHQAFRDPEVSYDTDTKKWRLLLHAALADGSLPAIARFTSSDLTHWQPEKPLMVCPKSLSLDCPHLFAAKGKWYLIAADRHYTAADSPEGPFSTDMLPYETGELFVPKTMFDGTQRILVGWVGDREGGKDSGKPQWGGTMCLPRDLYADDKGHLCERPARQVLEAYTHTVLSLPEGPKPEQEIRTPKNFLLHCRLMPTAHPATARIIFRGSVDPPVSGYGLTVAFDEKKVMLGDAHRTHERICDFDPAATMDVKAFVEDTVIECFINDVYCFTMRAYDETGTVLRLETLSGTVQATDLQVQARG